MHRNYFQIITFFIGVCALPSSGLDWTPDRGHCARSTAHGAQVIRPLDYTGRPTTSLLVFPKTVLAKKRLTIRCQFCQTVHRLQHGRFVECDGYFEFQIGKLLVMWDGVSQSLYIIVCMWCGRIDWRVTVFLLYNFYTVDHQTLSLTSWMRWLLDALLHFAWAIDDAKRILVMRICLSVCLSLHVAACRHYCMDPDVTWVNGRGALRLCTIGWICNRCMGFIAVTT